jgi:hypothetical protein
MDITKAFKMADGMPRFFVGEWWLLCRLLSVKYEILCY